MNDLKTLASAILNRPHIRVFSHTNADCIDCGIIEKDMLKVGAVVFCFTCFNRIFKTDDPVRKEKELYNYYLDRHTSK